MYNVIYKYALQPGHNTITLDRSAKILAVAEQHGKLCLWALVAEDGVINLPRHFYVALTGETLPFESSTWTFHGTVLMDKGNFVVHVFGRNAK